MTTRCLDAAVEAMPHNRPLSASAAERSITARPAGPAMKPAANVGGMEDDVSDEYPIAKLRNARILPYERPKLAMIKYEGDRGNRVIDLTRLPDDRLKQLKDAANLCYFCTFRQ
jgi:hypothetical protein